MKLEDKKVAPADAKTLAVHAMWHEGVDFAFSQKYPELKALGEKMFSEDIVFKPPTYWKTRHGRDFAVMALIGVSQLFEGFHYTREFVGKNSFALEFECQVTDKQTGKKLDMKGIDLITVNSEGKICELEVIARPPKAVEVIQQHQAAFFSKMQGKTPKL